MPWMIKIRIRRSVLRFIRLSALRVLQHKKSLTYVTSVDCRWRCCRLPLQALGARRFRINGVRHKQ